MINYVFKRLLKAIPVILIVLIFSFFVMHLMPGNPVRTMLGDKASEQQVIEMEKKLNLDKPLNQQFKIWFSKIIRGDFGESIFWKQSVSSIVAERIEPTFLLALIAILISVFIGIPLGLISAISESKIFNTIFSLVNLVSISIPSFWIALIFIKIFGVDLRIFPVSGYQSIADEGIINAIYCLILPGIILGIMHCGQISRMTRTAMLEILGQEYLNTARAIGVNEKRVVIKHAMINAISPIIMVIGFSFASLLGGAAVIEQIFNIPGIGNLTINAILCRDYTLVQGVLFIIALIFILVNLLVDITCAIINPKVRYE